MGLLAHGGVVRRPEMPARKLGLRRRGLSGPRTPRSEPTWIEIAEAIGALIAIALAIALTAQVALHFTQN
jgi:hypothetical protein